MGNMDVAMARLNEKCDLQTPFVMMVAFKVQHV